MSAAYQHAYHYAIGMKVEVGIPMINNQVFRDWAIINEVDDDLVSLQLSRDTLPEGITLRVGQMLNLCSEHDFQIYNCRAYIVSKGYEQELLLRLTGEIVANELREFYRIDAFLPIKFHVLPEIDPELAKKIWNERRSRRRGELRAMEAERLEAKRKRIRAEELAWEQRRHDVLLPGQAPGYIRVNCEEEGITQYDESWEAITSVAVNVSAGGMRIATDREFRDNDLLLLEIYVPSARSIVDIVARVIFSRRNDDKTKYDHDVSTGLQFLFIEEAARSAINGHSSAIQLKRIRQFKGFANVEPLTASSPALPNRHYAYVENVTDTEPEADPARHRRRFAGQVLLGLLLTFVLWIFYTYFSDYAVHHPKHAIQELFERGIRRFGGGN